MDRIVADPAIMGGLPCIRGTRIPVATIAGLLAEDVTVQEVLQHSTRSSPSRMYRPAEPTPPAATSGRPCAAPTTTLASTGAATVQHPSLRMAGLTERDGTPVPGLTVPDVARQLTWRVLGLLKGRAKSVLDWAGLRGEPPKTFHDAGRTYFVTGPAVARRVRRVAAEGARLPLSAELLAELTRPAAPGEDPVMRRRCAHLLGVHSPCHAGSVTADAHVVDPPAAHNDSSPDVPPDPPTPPE